MSLDWNEVLRLGCDKVKLEILNSSGFTDWDVEVEFEDGTSLAEDSVSNILEFDVEPKTSSANVVLFHNNTAAVDAVVLAVSYLKNGALVGSSLVQYSSCELKLLKYKVELPRGAKVTLFDDESVEAKFLAWNIPCPKTFPNMTFLQVKAANGFEKQITPSAGSQTIELFQELGRRYAVFGEIWTYSFAQTLWFADLRIQKSDYEWQDVVPTAGEGGTIVTALPQ